MLPSTNLSYYIYKDLRAAQNNNASGNDILRFDSLQDAVSEFRRLPKTWTTALGIRISPTSELDLVQRREGEPTLSGDYQRIPEYFYHPAVQEAVRKLVDQLHIQWQSDYRIFGNAPVLIPPILEQNFVRDRLLNGKQLCPDDPKYPITAIQELYVPEQGWQPLADVYDVAKKFGYDNPHKPKITTLHVRYMDEKKQVRAGDVNAYNFILLQERTKILNHDQVAIKALAKAIEEYISRAAPDHYVELFGSADRSCKVAADSFTTFKDLNAERIADLIKKQDLETLAEPIIAGIEAEGSSAAEQAEAWELLGRVLNIPESSDKRLSVDLRVRAGTAMGSLYYGDSATERAVGSPSREGRS